MKSFLVQLAVLLALSGCANENSGQPTTNSLHKQDIKKLSFVQKTTKELQSKAPDEDWTVAKKVSVGNTAVIVYEDTSGGNHSLIKHRGNYYVLNNFYDAKTVRIQELKGDFGDIKLIGGVGTDLTLWDVLGLNMENKLVSFETIGRPQMVDLDRDGTKELVASFEGAHLNFPNIEIVRVTGRMESAVAISQSAIQEDNLQFARLTNVNDSYQILIGKVREEGTERQYFYTGDQLVEITF
ncbi:hypothetical protein AB6A23_24670 [Paenibacillus tarimensis]